MKTLLQPVDLELNHVRVITQGMITIAQSDGLHDRELVLIRDFYESCRDEARGLTDFADLTSTPFDPEVAKDVLDSDALKLTFLASCYLVAYADGHVSDAEQKALESMARKVDIDAATLTQARELVKDQLLMQLARSANVEALKKLASQL